MNLTIWLVMESESDQACPPRVAVIAGTKEAAIEWVERTIRRLYSGEGWRKSGWLDLPDGGKQVKVSSGVRPKHVDFRVRTTKIDVPIALPSFAPNRQSAAVPSVPTLPPEPSAPSPPEGDEDWFPPLVAG
jgi:hypothetical protein